MADSTGRKMPLHTKIMIGMAVGIVAGLVVGPNSVVLPADGPMSGAQLGEQLILWTEWIGLLFLRLIKMVVVPLVFFSLVVGVASLGDFRKLGRIGGRTIG